MVLMSKQETLIPRKRRGPPATGKGKPIMTRVQPEELARLDAYIADQPEPISRPSAIRKILNAYLMRRSTRR